MWRSALIIHDALLLQSLQKTAHILANLRRIATAVCLRKCGRNLLDRTFPVAKFQDAPPSPLNSNHAFGKQNDLFITLRPPSATGGEMRLGGISRTGHAQDS